MIRLGVNVDHVATVRNARGGESPDPVVLALEAEAGGADQITVHLREDRRHIIDTDLPRLRRALEVDLNLEMAATSEMLGVALKLKPDQATLVPEKRAERTTEGGIDVRLSRLSTCIESLKKAGIFTALFVEPDARIMSRCAELGAQAVELHTGAYALARASSRGRELTRLREAAAEAHRLGLKVHAGHGLTLVNLPPILKVPHLREVNIGHALIARALVVGLRAAVREMKRKIKR
ncbi:MAG: pyridoxine 5'-phosphate synthase [Planctomycetota bacterium]